MQTFFFYIRCETNKYNQFPTTPNFFLSYENDVLQNMILIKNIIYTTFFLEQNIGS